MKRWISILAAAALTLAACTTPVTQTGDSRAVSSAVSTYGALKVVGNRVTSASGSPVQLKGMSLFWSQWAAGFYTAATINNMVDQYGMNLIRAAMGVENGGYLTNPSAEKAKVVTVVDAAVAKGIYVIIDWHEENAVNHQADSVSFFTEMANKYKNVPNVIFEIYNEPNGYSWSQIKTYAEAVLKAVRGTGANNLVVVGTPTWSQDVDVASQNPITAYSNVAYTLHFYAATHKQSLRDKASAALRNGIALFVTEFGTCPASGDGALDLTESQTWLDFLASNSISWANWSMNNKAESASALVSSATATGPWTASNLTQSGTWVLARVAGSTPTPSPTATPTPTSTPTATPTPTSTPAGTVKVTYTKNDWGSGFTATVRITNTGNAAYKAWKLAFSFAGNQKITNVWNANLTQTGQAVSATGVAYNADIPAGGSSEFGFQATYSGSNADPTNFTVSH